MSLINRRSMLIGASALSAFPDLAKAALTGNMPVFRVDGPGSIGGGVGDGIGPVTSSITTGTNILTRSSGSWTSADVGKLIVVNAAGGSSTTPLTTTISGFTNSTTVTLTANATSTATNQSCFYGTDNTAAINNTWAAARALNGGIVSIGVGTFCFTSLNLHNSIGTIFQGVGKQSGSGPTDFGTFLWPMSALASGNGNAIDFSGNTHSGIRNMQIGRGDILPGINVGVLIASKSGTESTQLVFEDLQIIGNWARGGIYQFAVSNVTYRDVTVYTYRNSSLAYAASFTSTNIAGVTSTNNTLAGGPADNSNVWCENCQFIEQGNTSGASNSGCVSLDGVDGWTFMNGLIGGASNNGLVQINDQTANWGSRNVYIENSSLQGFVGQTAPVYGINVISTITINGLKLAHLRFSDASNAHNSNAQNPSTAILQFGTNPAGLVNGLRIEGHPQTNVALINGGGGTQLSIDNGYIEAGGNAINWPGSVARTYVQDAGTVTGQGGAYDARYNLQIEKTGSGNGTDYNTASTSPTDVDATNLAFTTTIPTGMCLTVLAHAACRNDSAGDGCTIHIFDSQPNTQIDSADTTSPAAGQVLQASLGKKITGDGNAHTIKMQFNAVTGSTARLRNGNATQAPKMQFIWGEHN